MSENKSPLKNKLEKISFIISNPSLVTRGLEIVNNFIESISEAEEFMQDFKKKENESILLKIFNKETSNNQDLNKFEITDESIQLKTVMGMEFLKKLNHFKITGLKSLDELKSPVIIEESNFRKIETFKNHYISNIKINNYLGNKNVTFNLDIEVIQNENNWNIIYYLNIYDEKKSEILMFINEKNLHINQKDVKWEVPSKITKSIQSINDEMVIIFNII